VGTALLLSRRLFVGVAQLQMKTIDFGLEPLAIFLE
jgi:hypothetical protein